MASPKVNLLFCFILLPKLCLGDEEDFSLQAVNFLLCSVMVFVMVFAIARVGKDGVGREGSAGRQRCADGECGKK